MAIRLLTNDRPICFLDRLRGAVARDIETADGDFVIVRRDGLPAYHLAVVLDDAWQGITDVVRGADLLDSTPLHVFLQRLLGLETPRYWHIPLIRNASGEKLSKSTGATAIDTADPAETAAVVLRLLGLEVPRDLEGAPPSVLWAWAGEHWRVERLAEDAGPIAG